MNIQNICKLLLMFTLGGMVLLLQRSIRVRSGLFQLWCRTVARGRGPHVMYFPPPIVTSNFPAGRNICHYPLIKGV